MMLRSPSAVSRSTSALDPHPQPEVERHRPILDQQVVVAGAAS